MNRLDFVRELRSAVIEGCKSKHAKKKGNGKGRDVSRRLQKEASSGVVMKFAAWLRKLDNKFEELTGMQRDELFPGHDWRAYFDQGMDPKQLAVDLIQQAEDEAEGSEDSFSEGSDFSSLYAGLDELAAEFVEQDDDDEGEDEGVYEEADAAVSRPMVMDDVARAAQAVQESMFQAEASVMGGDYGRWKPATRAASAHGRSIASSLSKHTGVSYRFNGEGKASSAEGGSELWFEIEPEKSSEKIYYLGFKIYGDKEAPKWDVMLSAGAGLGSAKSVNTVKGVSSEGLSAAAGRVWTGPKQKEASE